MNEYVKQRDIIENWDTRNKKFDSAQEIMKFRKYKNKVKDIFINCFCLLGDEEGHIIVGLNKLHKVIILKPTAEGHYIKTDELEFNITSISHPMNVNQIEAVSDCKEISHRWDQRKVYLEMLD